MSQTKTHVEPVYTSHICCCVNGRRPTAPIVVRTYFQGNTECEMRIGIYFLKMKEPDVVE